MKLHYNDLNPTSRADIFWLFLKTRGASIEEEELRKYVEISLNGQQVRMVGI
jgi:hypothetical protein